MDFRISYIVFVTIAVGLVKPCAINFNGYSCKYDVFCSDNLDPNISWDRFSRLDFGFRQTINNERMCQKTIRYGGYQLYPVNLIYKQTEIDRTAQIPKTFEWENGILNVVQSLDLSDSGYVDMPIIKPMENLAILNVSRNQLTTAVLSNFHELSSLTEIDLSHNTIRDIQATSNPYPYSSLKKINLSHNYIVKIPDAAFDEIDDLQILDLSYNYIDTLSSFTFEGIKKLTDLNLSNNRLASVNSSLFRFGTLKIINLSNNRIKDLKPHDFERLGKLEFIDLSSNLMKTIDANVFKGMVSLDSIDLSRNQLETLNKNTFSNLESLRSINLSKNKIKFLPKSLCKNSSIYTFDVTENRLEGSLDKGMFDGVNVTKLDLSDQLLTEVKDHAFYYLLRLDTLLLNSNRIQSLSALSFSTLKNLQQLDLSNNQITDIGFDKKDLTGLQSLLLKNNRLTEIKQEHLQHLTNLEYLDVSENQISRLAPSSFTSMSNLINLEIYSNALVGTLETGTFDGLTLLPGLDISHNKLTVVQNASFNGMTELKQLNMSSCELGELQYNVFAHTGNIETLDLSHNKLKDFSVNTTELSGLLVLMLDNNLIKSVSSFSLGGLSRLNTITLSHNIIKNVHNESFNSLTDLRHLDLSYNEKIHFNVGMLQKVKTLNTLILSGVTSAIDFTHIVDDSPIANIVISNSSIQNISELNLSKMAHLDVLRLSYNNVSKLQIGDFTGISTLRYLDLSFNKISFIQPGVFKDNIHLHSLNISHNSLSTISYGIFRGLLYLGILDMSYNKITDLESERFYEVKSLTQLIVDYNQIKWLTGEEFVGTRLTKLSIGDNPLACHILVKLQKKHLPFEITAIRIDEHNHENIDGVTCNKVDENEPVSSPGEVINNNEVLNGLRNILTNFTKNIGQDNSSIHYLEKITDVLENFNSINDEKLSYLGNLTSKNIAMNNKTNTLLYKIFKSLDQTRFGAVNTTVVRILPTFTTTDAPLIVNTTKVNKTVDVVSYINDVKQELENTIAIEKQNIIHEIETKYSLNKLENEHFSSSVGHEKLVSNNEETKSLFTETCVALILFILVGLVLYKFYKSRMFIRNRFSLSTRELPGAMENSAL